MKKQLYIASFASVILIAISLSFVVPNKRSLDNVELTDTLLPNALHSAKAKLVSRLMLKNHYKKEKLSDALSLKIYKNYLESLDANKMYLLASDVEKLSEYKLELDDYIENGALTNIYKMYNVYQTRIENRIQQVLKMLKENKFDFAKHEYFDTDRKKTNWAKTNKELDDFWRKYIKSQILSLMLTDKSQKEAVDVIEKRYKRYQSRIKKQKSEDVFYLFMNAFTETYDPHTSYFSPIASDNFKIQMSRSLEGIGAVLRSENDYVTIEEVRPGGPAFKSKQLEKDDRITGVAQGEDGEMVDIVGWRLEEAIQLIRGKKGTVVRLQILPVSEGANAKPKEVKMIREKITLEEQSASKKLIEYSKNGKKYKVGVITLPSFYMDFDALRRGEKDYKSTSRDVRNLIIELKKENIDGLIIDLRYNGGGSLPEAIKMTGLFIKQGPVVQIKDSWGVIDVSEDEDDEQIYKGPLTVMVNRFSASASEIFSGAIQDYHRGVIVGENTFGKGTVQNVVDLNRQMPDIKDKLGHINLTLAKFYRITGSSTQNKGVKPDLELPSPFDFKEIGESASKSALPWDEIKTSKFDLYDDVTSKKLNKLKASFKKRLSTDVDLKKLLKDIEKIKDLRGETKVSLNFEKRKKEKEDKEGKNKSDKKDKKDEKNPMKDPYIKNAVMTVIDQVNFK